MGPKARLVISTTCSNGLLPRSGLAVAVAMSSSPSESGTCRTDTCFESGFREAAPLLLEGGGARRLGGGAKRRLLVDWVSFSYSTDVLRGTVVVFVVVVVREPEAHAELGSVTGCCIGSMSSAARVNAFAMLTVVSLTLHFSGLGGEAGAPPPRDELGLLRSSCLRRAYRTRAGPSSCCSSCAGRVLITLSVN